MSVKKDIKIKFLGFNKVYCPTVNTLRLVLQGQYNLVDSDQPDYIICSVSDVSHFKYNCVKIVYVGENVVPDFNLFDYAIGFHYLDFGDRYLRFPLWLMYAWEHYDSLLGNRLLKTAEVDTRRFCNFVYSNSKFADKIRERFFYELSKYKKIDSGGQFLNNMGYNIQNKLSFISNYKFTISFENSCVPGYLTEKIVEPMLVNSLPIYWGDNLVNRDFLSDSFLQLYEVSDIRKIVEYVVFLDENNGAYLDRINRRKVVKSKLEWEKTILSFFSNIFLSEPLEARRRATNGYNAIYEIFHRRVSFFYDSYLFNKIYGFIERLN